MAHVYADRVSDTTATTGTGAITVAAAAPQGFRTFSAVMTTGDTAHITIVDPATGDWETSKATYTASNELTRTTIIQSSNSNNAVSFGSGSKTVFLTVVSGSLKGQWEEISRAVASNSATIDFTLPAGYDEFLVKIYGAEVGTTARYLAIRTSTDGGSNFDSGASDYKQIVQTGVISAVAGSNNTGTFLYWTWVTQATTPNVPANGEVEIWRPAQAARCVITSKASSLDSGALHWTASQGYRDTAADVDAIRFFMPTNGNIASGTFVLLGRRK